jgi:hypothetical protein
MLMMITKTTIQFVKLDEIDFKNSCISYFPFAEVLTSVISNSLTGNHNAIMTNSRAHGGIIGYDE